ncbi:MULTISPECIES: hypothetical protein [unclassified Spirosoma]|uniref:hypothetical protein n=1 Tax=unclassified Spirosoma TaxID=2621999 RepID=UPI0009676779|nr:MULTISPECIES: hypothetical protein [unclassified Spirosoma]MBN8822891.1 hypothetical protein [Spirosoma sp.]OJW80083.1 MAG: hypothetical protein BGO59_02430 [Spirosoma sp. 48-14]
MTSMTLQATDHWAWWRKVLFRFSCIYLLLYMSPLSWLGVVAGIGWFGKYYGEVESWLVNLANRTLFHIKDVLVPLNGSGDTSYGYAQLSFFLLVALSGTVVWTLIDKRTQYTKAYYWLLVAVRYYVAMVAFTYGIIKLFGQQMIFPPLSALATPLGDFLPMRFSWYFIGYSTPYQFFSGAVEVVAGLLLLFRRTSTLGAFVAASVFLNVMMMNLCYDIPVKLFSIHLFLFSNFLLLGDANRLLNFFVFNRPTQPSIQYSLPGEWSKRPRLALKATFVLLFLIMPIYKFSAEATQGPIAKKLATGFFSVEQFQGSPVDSLRWQDVVFESNTSGSILTADTLFRQRYRRGYFNYKLDSLTNTITFRKNSFDTTALFTMHYTMPDTNHILLRGKIRTDSVIVDLKRQNRHFQLAERQFHWLSEANR